MWDYKMAIWNWQFCCVMLMFQYWIVNIEIILSGQRRVRQIFNKLEHVMSQIGYYLTRVVSGIVMNDLRIFYRWRSSCHGFFKCKEQPNLQVQVELVKSMWADWNWIMFLCSLWWIIVPILYSHTGLQICTFSIFESGNVCLQKIQNYCTVANLSVPKVPK